MPQTMDEIMSSRVAQTAAAMAPFICRAEESIWRGIERALDNGLGELLVTDRSGHYAGRTDLQAIRSLVRNGDYLFGSTLADVVRMVPVKGPFHIKPDIDAEGRIGAIAIDRGATFLPVSEPDLSHRELRNFLDAFLSTWISSTGDYVRLFEKRFAAVVGAGEGVAVSNGTVALHLALATLGIGPGDEVIVPDLTFVATANAVLHVGARPVIVDIDPLTWCLSADTIEAAITPRTRAVIPVHLFGRPAPMVEIMALCRSRGLYCIEDCAEAHGAAYDSRQIGSFSDISTFSFYANKILTTGEGGMCLTSDPALAAKLRLLRDHGMDPTRRYWHEEVGYNFRMTNPQAAIGCAQLDRFDELLAMRHTIQETYVDQLGNLPGVSFAPELPSRFKPVIWFACALVPPRHRAAIIAGCKDIGIDLRPFNNSLVSMPPYVDLGTDCPVSRALSFRGINLPTSSRIDASVVARIADVFKRVLVADTRGDADAAMDERSAAVF